MAIVIGPGINIGPGISFVTPAIIGPTTSTATPSVFGTVTTAALTSVSNPVTPFTVNCNAYNLDGSTGYMTLPTSADWSFGTGDFTIETFIRPTSATVTQVWASTQVSGNSTAGWSCFLFNSGYIGFDVYDGAEKYITASTTQLTANTWYHVAISKVSGTVNIYVNGVLQTSSGTMATTINAAIGVTIGRQQQAGYERPFGGYLTGFRICKGVGVYSGNYTVPTTLLGQTQQANPYGGSNTNSVGTGQCVLLLNP